ncbi:MAG: hypothetical protein CVU51_11080 [Deltaproteobacteria bacterium HGW-Deltaproteobacteria-1]|nr:MAG: hypothetical protein CVU51_11080 [Deltaproteobacteria bacterium HGW-Deltaproteobacteria-1]
MSRTVNSELLKIDRRIISRKLLAGELSEKDLTSLLKKLPDVSENVEEIKLPVIIHDRDAHEETLRMVKASGVRRGVFHCFSGDYIMARQCIDLGFYVSAPGVVTFDKSTVLHEVVRHVPLDSILLETDCPYLAPVPFRGRRNEPSFIVHTAKKVAALKGVDWEEVALTAARNTRKLFGIAESAAGHIRAL